MIESIASKKSKGFDMKPIIILIGFFLFNCESLWAWGDLGHSVIGEIAQRNLTQEGKVLVQNILGVEPLAVAATWPDHMRDDSRFKPFADYHFFQTDKSSFKDVTAAERAKKDADTIISRVPNLIVDPQSKLNKEQKKILLKYFIHVVGDIHQPLHVGYPTDMGANLCDVYLPNYTKETKLHSIWDTKLLDYIESGSPAGKETYYPKLTELILKEYVKPIVISDSPSEWYDESRQLLSNVYPDKEQTSPENRTYCKRVDPKTHKIVDGKYDSKTLPHLDKEYIDKAVPIIKKQLWLGGLRLAHLLNQMGEKYKSKDYLDEDKLIKEILIENENVSRKPQSQSKKSSLKK